MLNVSKLIAFSAFPPPPFSPNQIKPNQTKSNHFQTSIQQLKGGRKYFFVIVIVIIASNIVHIKDGIKKLIYRLNYHHRIVFFTSSPAISTTLTVKYNTITSNNTSNSQPTSNTQSASQLERYNKFLCSETWNKALDAKQNKTKKSLPRTIFPSFNVTSQIIFPT